LAEEPALALLLFEGEVQLLLGQETVLEEKLAQPFILPNPEAADGLRLDGAHAASRAGASNRRRTSCNASGVKRRCRPGVRNAGWMSPRFTADQGRLTDAEP